MDETSQSVRDAWSMICPCCGQDDELDIAATVNVRLCPNGTDADAARETGHTWDSDSAATCTACNWSGTVRDAEAASNAFPPGTPIITPEMVAAGAVLVEVYPMVRDADGARLTEGSHEAPDFYDVSLRPNNFETNDNDTYADWEDLSLAEATATVTELEAKYLGINVSWINT